MTVSSTEEFERMIENPLAFTKEIKSSQAVT
jgi:hypothetical protein